MRLSFVLDQQVSARDHTVVEGECRSELFDRDLVVDLTRSSQKRFVEPSSSGPEMEESNRCSIQVHIQRRR